MRVTVILIQKDLTNREEHIIADGPALLTGDKLVYVEKDTNLRHTVTFGSDEVILERAGEYPSRTVLKAGKGISSVDSPYGKMVMETRLKKKSKTPNLWMVEYQIVSGGDIVLHQQLQWRITGLN